MTGTQTLHNRLRAIERRAEPLTKSPAMLTMIGDGCEDAGTLVVEHGSVQHVVERDAGEGFAALLARVEAEHGRGPGPLITLFLRPLHAAPLEEDETL